MVPQNNYTLKHNNLTKSSSWRGARWILVYGNMSGHHIIPANQKLMRSEDLKTHIPEVERCQQHPQTKSVPPVFFLDNLWEIETLQLKPGDRQRGSTTNNNGILTLDVCLLPRIFISFAMISNNKKLFQNSIRTLLAHLHKNILIRGTWRLIEMTKWVLAEPTTDSESAWNKVISSCRIRFFSDSPWMNKNWLSIGGFTYLSNLLLTHFNLMKLSTSNDISMIFQGYVEKRN